MAAEAHFPCLYCGFGLRAEPTVVGASIRCFGCGKRVLVPGTVTPGGHPLPQAPIPVALVGNLLWLVGLLGLFACLDWLLDLAPSAKDASSRTIPATQVVAIAVAGVLAAWSFLTARALLRRKRWARHSALIWAGVICASGVIKACTPPVGPGTAWTTAVGWYQGVVLGTLIQPVPSLLRLGRLPAAPCLWLALVLIGLAAVIVAVLTRPSVRRAFAPAPPVLPEADDTGTHESTHASADSG